MPAPLNVPPQYEEAGIYTQSPEGQWYVTSYGSNRNPKYYWVETGAPARGRRTIDWSKANPSSVGSGYIQLGTISPATRPPESSTWRYPMADKGQGGIHQDGDYVMFQFYNYIPPFGPDRLKNKQPNNKNVPDYNMAKEYNQAEPASSYKTVLLYMPEDISTGFRANWDGKSMSNMAAATLRSFGAKGLGNKVAAGASAINRLFEKSGALVGAATIKEATSRLGGDALSYDDIFGGISGGIMNPNTELLFGGVQMRNFPLDFKLVPRHSGETEQINNIITQFKRAMLPTKSPGDIFGFNKKSNNLGIQLGFIGVPKIIKVSFMRGSNENDKLPRYKMCALTSVDVNYTPDGTYATYSDGQPVAIGLTLNFQETKICFSEDIGKSVR